MKKIIPGFIAVSLAVSAQSAFAINNAGDLGLRGSIGPEFSDSATPLPCHEQSFGDVEHVTNDWRSKIEESLFALGCNLHATENSQDTGEIASLVNTDNVSRAVKNIKDIIADFAARHDYEVSEEINGIFTHETLNNLNEILRETDSMAFLYHNGDIYDPDDKMSNLYRNAVVHFIRHNFSDAYAATFDEYKATLETPTPPDNPPVVVPTLPKCQYGIGTKEPCAQEINWQQPHLLKPSSLSFNI